MVEADAVLEVADGVLDLGVAAVVGLQLQGAAVAVGDERVLVVVAKQGELRAGGGPHPADDQACDPAPAAKRPVAGLGDVGAAVQPVADRRPGVLGDAAITARTALVTLTVIG